MKTAIQQGHQINAWHIATAVESANIDTIRLIANSLLVTERSLYKYHVAAYDLTVTLLEELLTLDVLQRGKQCKFEHIHSIPVLKWLLDHDMMNTERVLRDVAYDAAEYGGDYVDVLHYMIEELHIKVPKDILSGMSFVTDLGVIDYLLYYGADINVLNDNYQITAILLTVRYCLDRGVIVQQPVKVCEYYVKSHDMSVTLIETMLDMLLPESNVLECSKLLHTACTDRSRTDVIEMLIRRGANINYKDERGRTALHIACQDSMGRDRREIVELLLRHGAKDEYNEDAYHYGHSNTVRQLILRYGYETKAKWR